jgi:hypothetical protein
MTCVTEPCGAPGVECVFLFGCVRKRFPEQYAAESPAGGERTERDMELRAPSGEQNRTPR